MSGRVRWGFGVRATIVLVGVLAALVFGCVSTALGSVACGSCRPWWHLSLGARPSMVPREGKAQLVLTVSNLGDAAIDGKTNPVTISDVLPEGFRKESIEAVAGFQDHAGPAKCSLGGAKVSPHCTFEGVLPAFDQIEVRLDVSTEGVRSGASDRIEVQGGNAAAASASRPVTVGAGATPFGVQSYELAPEEEGGAFDTQAGSHPFQLTTTIELNQTGGAVNPKSELLEAEPPVLTKDLRFRLPTGLVGNPTVFPRCTIAQFSTEKCPADTALGVALTSIDEPRSIGLQTITVPLFNLEPATGEPARFGFAPTLQTPVYLDTAVRTGEDYGVTVNVDNIVQVAGFLASEVTFWGVPGDPRHDAQRGYGCLKVERVEDGLCESPEAKSPPPLLSLPTSCVEPFATEVSGDSWEAPLDVQKLASYTLPEQMDGCNRLPFSPEVRVTPDGTAASSPTGLNVDVHVPQDSVLVAKGLAESSVKTITVALPEGVAINPAGGDGLGACSEAQIGYLPEVSVAPEALRLTAGLPEPFCPPAAKVGTVTIHTPLLPNPLTGAVYIASQNTNPFGSLVAMYLVAEDSVSGTLVKLPGEVRIDPSTGQVTGVFRNSPELPFEDAELHFFGGERAPLATPARCGAYTTHASFVPWAAEPSGEAAVTVASSSTFQITSGPDGSACPGASLPFSPRLTGGATNINAGGFTPMSTTIGREDGEQNMAQVTLHMPPGFSGLLSGVKLCPEEQANNGTCGPESLIGETTVSAGVGSDPVSVKGGRVYITEKYGDAPFGLSIVNPVKAGPFDLEHDTSNPSQYMPACDCIVVRAKINVNPIDATLTVTTNRESEGFAIPHTIDGIPVQIKKVNVLINRPGFVFNPTDCDPRSITGSIESDEGALSPVSVGYQVANCATLAFKPGFKVSATGRNTRKSGAGLHVLLTYPKARFGTQSNIRSVKVDLPKQLPSRLTTLQQACTERQFAVNPAGCPAASIVGHAKAVTPLIPVPLEGPAYFVSHGGAKFPELIVVLQGYGVTIDLQGETFIDGRTGVTSSTFHTIPDAPVGSFELTLPQGANSALATSTNICGQTKTKLVRKKVTVRAKGHPRQVTRTVRTTVPAPLLMPTIFTAQNGQTIKQSTPIEVTGCPKTRSNAKKAARGRGAARGRRAGGQRRK